MHRLSPFILLPILIFLCFGSIFAKNFDPIYQDVQTEEGSFFAVRPFYSRTLYEEGEIHDVLWPLYSRKSFKNEASSRALFFYWTHRFNTDEESPRKRRWLLPFFFQGRDLHGENYAALFPLGGTIHEFIGRDRLSFVLFPIYGTGQINDVKTTNVLWPIYSKTRGEGVRRDRVFPIYGKSTLEGAYKKKFICWPFWTSAEYVYPGDSGTSWIFFPFFGRANLDNEKTTWLIPPFFRFTKGTNQNRTYCPWPFYQRITSEWRERHYLWPLWGKDQYGEGLNRRTFVLWPFCWSDHFGNATQETSRRMLLPVFYSKKEYLREDGVSQENQAPISTYWKVWPLMSWQRTEDTSRFRLLELWPLQNTGPIERNWAPIWTLYKRTSTDGVIRKKALWFAWDSERSVSEDRSEWSLLKGLLSFKKEGESKSLKVLYFLRFGE